MNYNPLKGWSRELQAGERAYISSIKIKTSDIVFGLQTIPQDANVAAYRAHISFQFQKGELSAADFKRVDAIIAEVLTIEAAAPVQDTANAEAPAPSDSQQDVLHDQDIIDLVKAGLDEATILTKIANSKCQFDTCTPALINPKNSGVSPSIIKAMVQAGK